MLVLDASAVLAWAFDDEVGGPDAIIDHVTEESATVPAHWVLELTNSLIIGERLGRLSFSQRQDIQARIQRLPIRMDPELPVQGWTRIPELAIRHRLTTYDAAYLELALRLDVPLATLDQDLRRAAHKAGVPLFE